MYSAAEFKEKVFNKMIVPFNKIKEKIPCPRGVHGRKQRVSEDKHARGHQKFHVYGDSKD